MERVLFSQSPVWGLEHNISHLNSNQFHLSYLFVQFLPLSICVFIFLLTTLFTSSTAERRGKRDLWTLSWSFSCFPSVTKWDRVWNVLIFPSLLNIHCFAWHACDVQLLNVWEYAQTFLPLWHATHVNHTLNRNMCSSNVCQPCQRCFLGADGHRRGLCLLCWILLA